MVEKRLSLGKHEVIIAHEEFFALRLVINVCRDGVEILKSEYGEFDEKSGFRKIGDCDARVYVEDHTIYALLKKR